MLYLLFYVSNMITNLRIFEYSFHSFLRILFEELLVIKYRNECYTFDILCIFAYCAHYMHFCISKFSIDAKEIRSLEITFRNFTLGFTSKFYSIDKYIYCKEFSTVIKILNRIRCIR